MKIIEIINLIKEINSVESLFNFFNLDIDSEFIWMIYAREVLDLNSEVELFSEEETEGRLVFEKNGVNYIAFFALDHLWDLLNNEFANYPNDETLGNRLMHYRKYDA